MIYYHIFSFCASALIGLLAYRNVYLKTRLNLKQKIIESLEKKLSDRGKQISLEEFLSDINRYGYSYLRIDPKDMFYRNPRGE